jgi:hypothetical protein
MNVVQYEHERLAGLRRTPEGDFLELVKRTFDIELRTGLTRIPALE